MSDVPRAVDAANPEARLVEIGAADIGRLCKWLGSTEDNRRFNALARYVLHEQSRYCPAEDHDEHVANVPGWNWRNPFTAYNCTWGFATPQDFPEPADGRPPCAQGGAGVALAERTNSTTCPRAMLCQVAVHPDGRPTIPLQKASRCNLEGYGGLDYQTFGNATREALDAMPGGRCPYPPGDIPGPGPGFERKGDPLQRNTQWWGRYIGNTGQ